jgi:hypothetical protein
MPEHHSVRKSQIYFEVVAVKFLFPEQDGNFSSETVILAWTSSTNKFLTDLLEKCIKTSHLSFLI